VKNQERQHADRDSAQISLDLSRMPAGHETPETARTGHGLIDAGVDAALVDAGAKSSEQLPESAESSHESVPDVPIHPVGNTRSGSAESDHRPFVKFVEP